MDSIHNKCRLCLNFIDPDSFIWIFSEKANSPSISEILARYFWFEVNENDCYSKRICLSCWDNVNSFHLFYVKIYECHHSLSLQLNDIYETKATDDKPFDDNKIYDICNNDDAKKAKSKQKCKKSLPDKTTDDDQIRGFFKMCCELCSTKFDTFHTVETHYRAVHNIKGYLRCCNKKYIKKLQLLEHIERHLNPESFKCKLCNKIYADNRGLTDHLQRHSEKKPFKCSLCTKSYTKNFLLQQHVNSHSNEPKQFICDQCYKSYATKTHLQAHKKNVHEGAYVQVCDICAKVFRNKAIYDKHYQTSHSEFGNPKVQCQICGLWLKHKHYLRQHLIRHEESTQKHVCNICGKYSPNQKALRSHIQVVHTREKSHECRLCNKSFKTLITLREHTATHTGEALYICSYCPKKFNSSGNMYAHKKKAHVKEWEQEKILKETGM